MVTFTCGDVCVLDRFTGELRSSVTLDYSPPMDGDGNVVWQGRTFDTGATTPSYDSGCLYFGTADGRTCCYGLSAVGELSEVWTYEPPADYMPWTEEAKAEVYGDQEGSMWDYRGTRGCFYYHAPVVVRSEGQHTVFAGSYEGYIYALDAETGAEIWVKRAIDLRSDNPVARFTPGSVASISVSPDGGSLVAECTDGGIFTLTGYLLGMDPATGSVAKFPGGGDWRIDVQATRPVSDGEYLYSYLSPAGNGGAALRDREGNSVEVTGAVYKLDWDGCVVWKSEDYNFIKSQLTLADGRIYAMDYSPGAFWPTGGCMTCLDSETGAEVWRALLKPYTGGSYSMCSVTVIDGRLYTGNDLGALYCLSEMAGVFTEEEYVDVLHTVGFRHWSWAVLVIVTAVSATVAYRFYK